MQRILTDFEKTTSWSELWNNYKKKVATAELPAHSLIIPKAPSLRHGAIETLTKHMPFELIAPVSGHDLSGVSRLMNYVGEARSHMIPAAKVLSGWAPSPWGTIGKCPTPPNLMLLINEQVSTLLVAFYYYSIL